MLGKPWLSKPIKPDTEVKTLSLCPNCNCMTKTIDGACGKCKGTKMKTDWEEEIETALIKIESLHSQVEVGDFDGTVTSFNKSKEVLRKLLAKQEEQHKKELEKSTEGIRAIYLLELNQLKQQHIKQRKTLSDIHWEHLKRVKQQHRADLVSLIKRIEDVGLTPNGTRMIVLSNSEWIEIKEQLLNSQKGK